jgi:hypothetical protein
MRRRWLGRTTLWAAAVLVVSVASASSVNAATLRVRAGNETVTLTYHGSDLVYHGLTLVESRAGTVVAHQLVHSAWCGERCGPIGYPSTKAALHLVRLGRSATQNIVLTLYSGGAHCCTIEQVYATTATKGHLSDVERNFGDPGVRLVDLGPAKSEDFLTANDAFAYKFTDFAASGMPLEILRFYDGGFHDVTRTFPGLIAKDAAQWMGAFKAQASSHYGDTTGVVAAWVADEDMLGKSASAQQFLDREAVAGHLNSGLGSLEPEGKHFVTALQMFLRKEGYQ